MKFHRDRNEFQPTPYSLYTRDPFDEEQMQPRTSSTLFIANIVAYLQCIKEEEYDQIKSKGTNSHYNIFQNADIPDLINKTILEHRWDEPENIGEISMIDNRTMLHASFYRNPLKEGYRIGVRYLS